MTILTKNIKTTYMPGSPGVPGTPGSPFVPAHLKTVVDKVIPGAPTIPASVRLIYYDTGVFNPFLVSVNRFGNFNSVGVLTVNIPARGGTPPVVTYKTILVPAVAAVAPTPGIPPTRASVVSNFNLGWNTGAVSRLALNGNLQYAFTASAAAIGIVTGLNDINTGVNYREIDYGLYLSRGSAVVYESGVQKGFSVPFTSADTFKITRRSGVVTYTLNDAPIYTSQRPSSGTMFADSSMYSGGDAITSASLSPMAETAGGRSALQPVASFGSDAAKSFGRSFFPALTSNAGAYGRAFTPNVINNPSPTLSGETTPGSTVIVIIGGVSYPATVVDSSWFVDLTVAGPGGTAITLPNAIYTPIIHVTDADGNTTSTPGRPFTVDSSASEQTVSAGKLAALTAFGTDREYAGGRSVLSALTADGGAGQLSPSFTIGIASLAYVLSTGRILSGEVLTVAPGHALAPLDSFGADRNYAGGLARFSALDSIGLQGVVADGIVVATLKGKFLLNATGVQTTLTGVRARLTMPTLLAFSGSGVSARMPSPIVNVSGQFEVVGRLRPVMPRPRLFIGGSVGAIAQIEATLTDAFTVKAYTGAVVNVRPMERFKAVASGVAGGQGVVRAVMPLVRVDARGTEDSIARVLAAMPMLRPVPSAILRALAPRFTVVASGYAVVQATYEAYAINLLAAEGQPNEVTHYTNFPFNQIVRHGEKYYGVSNTGLYLLGGDKDVSSPIPWAIETAKTDFGAIEEKTVLSAYMGGTVTAGATVRVLAGEYDQEQYAYPVPQSANRQTWRTKFGRGLKTRYFAMAIEDRAGGAFAADAIDLEVAKLKRKL